jgi:hypothetical protein
MMFGLCFSGLPNRGRGRNGIDNADYDIDDPRVRKLLQLVQDRGSENGLHKSALKSSYSDELATLLPGGIVANRNHYLRFFMPDTWNAMESAGVHVDMTLGFPEHPGFRTGYGHAFQPFILKEKRAYNVVEVPLLVMDTSYKYYMNVLPEKAGDQLLSFLDANKEEAILNILWHNNYFFNRIETGWLQIYKDVLVWAHENGISSSTSTAAIMQDFSLESNDGFS